MLPHLRPGWPASLLGPLSCSLQRARGCSILCTARGRRLQRLQAHTTHVSYAHATRMPEQQRCMPAQQCAATVASASLRRTVRTRVRAGKYACCHLTLAAARRCGMRCVHTQCPDCGDADWSHPHSHASQPLTGRAWPPITQVGARAPSGSGHGRSAWHQRVLLQGPFHWLWAQRGTTRVDAS